MVNMAEKSECFLFSPKAACYGVFAQYGFRCVLGELGRFREGTGIRELVPGSVSQPDSRNRGIKKVAGSGDSVPTLLKFLCTVYFQSILLYFENVISPCENALLGVESVIFLLCKYTSFVLCHHAWEKKRWCLVTIYFTKCKPSCCWDTTYPNFCNHTEPVKRQPSAVNLKGKLDHEAPSPPQESAPPSAPSLLAC